MRADFQEPVYFESLPEASTPRMRAEGNEPQPAGVEGVGFPVSDGLVSHANRCVGLLPGGQRRCATREKPVTRSESGEAFPINKLLSRFPGHLEPRP
jgi:hypothetical protein